MTTYATSKAFVSTYYYALGNVRLAQTTDATIEPGTTTYLALASFYGSTRLPDRSIYFENGEPADLVPRVTRLSRAYRPGTGIVQCQRFGFIDTSATDTVITANASVQFGLTTESSMDMFFVQLSGSNLVIRKQICWTGQMPTM